MPSIWYFVAALIPMVVGSVWYGPLFGKAWMKTNGFTEESLKGGNMLVILGLSYILSILLAFFLGQFTIHQAMLPGLAVGSTDPQLGLDITAFMDKWGGIHRTWSHGAVHGGLAAIAVALPLIAINALFERRGGKYIGIHFGYWFVTLLLMGALICATV